MIRVANYDAATVIEWQVGTRVHIKKIEKLKGAIGERDCLARANTGEDCFWTSIIWEKNR